MADYTVTAANVALIHNQVSWGIAAKTLTPGQVLVRESDKRWGRAECTSSATAGVGLLDGLRICLSSASANQQVALAPAGSIITLGAVLTPGQALVLSVNEGKIAPISDLSTGNWLVYLGTAISTSQFVFLPKPTGRQY